MSVNNNGRCFCDLKAFETNTDSKGKPLSDRDKRRMRRIQIIAQSLLQWFAEDTTPTQPSKQQSEGNS